MPLHRLWMRTSTSGVKHIRLSLYRLEIPRSGTYTLRVAGVDPAVDYGHCAVVFVRPHGPGLVATIVALIASVGLAAGGAATIGALFLGSRDPVAPASPASTPPAPASQAPVAAALGGRRLASDPARLRDGQEVVWPVLRMHVRVPSDWVVRKRSETELDLRHPTTPSTFLVARATPMPAGPSIDDYLEAHLVHAREGLAAKRIEGYATRRIGAVGGVLTLEQRSGGDTWMVTWMSFQPAELGSLSVTLLVGATAADFARDEALLGAVVDSIRFE